MMKGDSLSKGPMDANSIPSLFKMAALEVFVVKANICTLLLLSSDPLALLAGSWRGLFLSPLFLFLSVLS